MRTAMVAALLVIGSCGDGGGGGPGGTYSCRASLPGADGGAGMVAVCVEATGGTAQDTANNQQQCAAQGNMFAAEPCPRTSALGGCRETVVGSSLVLTTWYYADGGGSAADIQMLCEGLASVAPPSLMITFVLP